MLAYTNITAPFSGVISQKLADAGSLANPGMPLLVLEQMTTLHIKASITESDIAKIKEGMLVKATIKSIGREVSGTITEVSRSSQLTGGQYQIHVDIPSNEQSEIYAGMYTKVFIPMDKKEVVAQGNPLIPIASVINRDQLTGIYTVSDNETALLRWVRLGKTVGDEVEVISGLNAEEQFVRSAAGKLYNGAKVIVNDELTDASPSH